MCGLMHLLKKLQTIHKWHLDVGKDHIKRLLVSKLHRFKAISCAVDLIIWTQALQHFAKSDNLPRLVVHQ
ncbi:hypothetical protein D3C87_1334480 [compost metagenome]